MFKYQESDIKRLLKCFQSLDIDHSNAINVDELKIPLIGLGFADTVDEVKDLVDKYDSDGSGEIEFEEFLHIIQDL